ncbi:hypothetical protein E2C01_031958 [Portunus trituberculatus]|uniref:Uncharacterized protein n=1 Tax=Portunus trituberculatus TaxID=210409 RepID=A0A5B7EW62_PORTR|nr:hypothetical protein [Portunus trituberculatus]
MGTAGNDGNQPRATKITIEKKRPIEVLVPGQDQKGCSGKAGVAAALRRAFTPVTSPPTGTPDVTLNSSALLTSTCSSVSAGGGRTPRRDLMLKGSSFSGNTSLSTPSRVTMNLVFSPLKHNFVTTLLKQNKIYF